MTSRIAFLLFAFLAFVALATALRLPQKSVVISFPSGTPGHVLEQTEAAITEAGGFITHEYKLFKGFAATAPVKAFEQIKTLAAEWVPVIEEDQIVSIQ